MGRFPLRKIAPSGRFIEDPESASDRIYLPIQVFRKRAGMHPGFLDTFNASFNARASPVCPAAFS